MHLLSVLLNYLQTSESDVLTANRLISQVFSNIEKVSRDFEVVKIAADNYVILIKHNLDTYGEKAKSISIQDKLAKDEKNQTNALPTYKISVFNVIMHTTVISYKHRFNKNTKDWFKGLSCLDPAHGSFEGL